MAATPAIEGAARQVAIASWQPGGNLPQQDWVAEEVPVAISYNGISHAVMMATPLDLSDFALGFSLTEGIIQSAQQLYDCELHQHPEGMELRLQIPSRQQHQLQAHRRNLQGRTGCGLCGVESLQQVQRDIARLSAQPKVCDHAIQAALEQLPSWQPLRRATGACHGAAWCDSQGQIMLSREDVGRHNALDKLIGALARADFQRDNGFALVSSRASFEMVQKAAAAGIGNLVAVSAPTALALDCAQRYGVNLIGFARPGRHCRYHCTENNP